EHKGLWTSRPRKQIKELVEAGLRFAEVHIKAKRRKEMFINILNRTKAGDTFQMVFKKYIKQRKLPVTYEDITDCKKIRDSIVHYGSLNKLERQLNCNDLSNRLEALVRNLIVYYLGLKVDPEWKKWQSMSCWRPKRR
ncbi:hypothetical protein IBX73_11300, partial [candidate division WOR-3 bacterium]|nr:hypothetical protein [candidate division WOR-3 bacterium]